MEILTKKLSENDFKNDAEWKDEAIILTNNNHDRHFFNKLSVKNFGKNNSKIIITWKNPLQARYQFLLKFKFMMRKLIQCYLVTLSLVQKLLSHKIKVAMYISRLEIEQNASYMKFRRRINL